MDLNTERSFGAIERMSEGLQSYFAKVYNYMAGGLAVSGVVAWLTAREPFIGLFYKMTPQGVNYSLLGWVAVFSPLILIFMISSSLNKLKVNRAQGLFWLFSGLMGVSLSNIFLFFSGESIFQAFLITAGMFAGMSLYGYTTKRSLASWGSFLFMGLIGIILASLVNLFVQSSAFNFGISVIAVFIFVGLTAYDTQTLKNMYSETDGEDVRNAKAISGALSLYLDFINLFRLMLYFLNDRK